MSDNSEEPEADGQVTPPGSADNGDSTAPEDFREALKRDAKKYRLSPEWKAQILAEMPPPEEQARLYRELQEQGGLSSEEFLASLGLLDETQP